MTISRWNLLRMRNVSGKCCRENKNAYFMVNNTFPKIMTIRRCWKNTEPKRPQTTIWRVRSACWITKAISICITLLFHGNNGYTNGHGKYKVTLCYLIFTVPVLFMKTCVTLWFIVYKRAKSSDTPASVVNCNLKNPIRPITKLYIYAMRPSFCVLNLMLHASRPNSDTTSTPPHIKC